MGAYKGKTVVSRLVRRSRKQCSAAFKYSNYCLRRVVLDLSARRSFPSESDGGIADAGGVGGNGVAIGGDGREGGEDGGP